jgi:hypothetical protein
MADTKYLEALIDAIKFVYEDEHQYFDKLKGCEQAVEFRIAHRMANFIESAEPDVNVDCEIRKCNGILKFAEKRPDIVVHKRKNIGYLVVEIKCDRRNRNNDFEKLELFTLVNKPNIFSTNVPTYELGVFVYLTDKLNDIEFRIYENGIDTTENYLAGILKGFKHAE